jgi:hypothetical protein
MLKERLSFTENTTICVIGSSDIIFTNVTSKFLPNVSSFLSFWEKHIIISNASNEYYDEEYEIDEIASLYKLTNKSSVNISDKEMIKMIWHYFYPQVEVIDNKYITNIRCNLWCKHDDINDALSNYKVHKNILLVDTSTLISFDELYQNYKSYIQAKIVVEKSFHPIVSKHFFEKFLSHYLAEYINLLNSIFDKNINIFICRLKELLDTDYKYEMIDDLIQRLLLIRNNFGLKLLKSMNVKLITVSEIYTLSNDKIIKYISEIYNKINNLIITIGKPIANIKMLEYEICNYKSHKYY